MANSTEENIHIDWKPAIIIFAVALVVRFVMLLELSASPLFVSYVTEQRLYQVWATVIQQSTFIPTTPLFKPPLYAYFVWLFYAISGSSRFVVGLAQVILGAASCSLVFMIAGRFFSRKIAIAAGLILGLFGTFMFLDTQMLPTTLTIFLVLAATAMLAHYGRNSSHRLLLAAGFLIGLAALAEPPLAFVGIFLLIWLALRFQGGFAWKFKRWALILIGMLIAIAPVTLHNLFKSGSLIPISSDAGLTFFAGNNLGADGRTGHLQGYDPYIMFDFNAAKAAALSITGDTMSHSELCRFFAGQGIKFVTTTPGKELLLTLKRLALLLNGHETLPEGSIYFQRRYSALLSISVWDFLLSFPSGLIIPLAVLGLVASLGNWRRLTLLYSVGAALALAPLFLYVNADTRGPLIALSAIFASIAIVGIVRSIKSGEQKALVLPAVVLVTMLFISNYDFVDVEDNLQGDYLRVGDVAMSQGKLKEAEKAFSEGLAEYPESPFLLNALASVYLREGIYQEAESRLDSAVSILPRFVEAHRNRVELYQDWGKKDKLDEAAKALLRYDNSNTNALLIVAEDYIESGHPDSALPYYEKLVQINPNEPNYRFGLGNAYLRLQEPEKARDIYEDMVHKYPEEPTVHLNLGLAYVQLKEYYLAEEQFLTTLYHDSTNTYAYYNLAKLYEEQGDTAMATNLLLQVFTMDPDFFENPEEILDTLLIKSGIKPDEDQ
jgi:tetratricopeptide (TPR) repeat protein/4-amino-4-deoxy-L-arabinose transferase-like glycosyltransferase